MGNGICTVRWAIVCAASLCLLVGAGCSTEKSSAAKNSQTSRLGASAELDLHGGEPVKFDLDSDADLERLAREVSAALKQIKKLPGDATARQQSSAKEYRRGLQEVRRLAEAARTSAYPAQRHVWAALLLETVDAMNNTSRPRVPRRIELVLMPWVLFKEMHRPMARGRAPATDLAPGPSADLSRLDPLPNIFWQRPADIASEDLYRGFGRTDWPDSNHPICDYARPKDSFGTNPGFRVDCDGVETKLKFGEVSSEPLATRIFSALGFHADATDYAPQARVHYNRQIFLEFYSRQDLKTKFTLLGVPYYTMNLQKRYDPFDYIAWAVRRDGGRWTGRELKAQLFRDAVRPHPEQDAANFRPEIESQIDYLITVRANVQAKDPEVKNIGPWDYAQLDHPGRRELRGAGLVAAWLGFFDTRFDNTRLRVVDHDGCDELAGYFSDLGGGLGETKGLLFQHGERPNAFPWTFTRPQKGRATRPLLVDNYKPMAPTAPFAAMTLDDARWMARLIGQLTERQIIAALVASGYDSAEVRLYTEKLISRRDRMVTDLGLGGEIPPLRPGGSNRKFSYDPAVDGPVAITVPGLGEVKAPASGMKINGGKLVGKE